MFKNIALGVFAAAALFSAPASARDAFKTDYGINENRYAPRHRESHRGAWIGNNRGHAGAHHGGHWGGGHGQFSPRGQGGYHWGW